MTEKEQKRKEDKGAGKGDAPRHNIRKFDDGWEIYQRSRKRRTGK